VPVLITPKTEVNEDAQIYLEGVVYWDIDDFRKWSAESLAAIREIRSGFAAGDLAWRAGAADVLIRSGIAPDQLLAKLSLLVRGR
jgi:hypothetical protein